MMKIVQVRFSNKWNDFVIDFGFNYFAHFSLYFFILCILSHLWLLRENWLFVCVIDEDFDVAKASEESDSASDEDDSDDDSDAASDKENSASEDDDDEEPPKKKLKTDSE